MRTKKHDTSMLPLLFLCIALAAVFAGIVIYAVSYSHRYNVFPDEMAECILYCREHDSLQITAD